MRESVKRLSTGPSGSSSLRSALEVAGVIATGGLHLVLVHAFSARAVFIAVSVAAWTSYIWAQLCKDPGLLRIWGFSRLGLRDTLTATTVVAMSAAAIMAIIALSQDALSLQWHMLPLLLLYPIWGLVQQFLVQALVAANLKRAAPAISSTWIVTPICGLLFGIVHLPDLRLAGCTFLLGLVFTPIYLKWRNLWPLGLYHGWLGVLFYFWILRRDPWSEVIRPF